MSTKNTSMYSSVKRVGQSILIVLVVIGLLGPTATLAHPPGVTEWVSVSSDGTGANSFSDMPAISADGRFVAFVSLADNLVPEDTNGFADTFVHDRLTATTERVSVSSREREGNGHSGLVGVAAYPAISGDGRFVAFVSEADNLVSGDRNGLADVFVRDRLLGTTERVSVSGDGSEANGSSEGPAISADGRFVAFHSNAPNLVPGANPPLFAEEVYVRDRATGTTEIISINSAGEAGNNLNFRADISADGRFVVFSSSADNLVPGLQSGHQVYLRDRAAGTIERISEDATGNPGDGTSVLPKVSLDGRFVAFQTNTGNLIGDGNHESHILVKDRVTGTFERVSATSTGEPADLLSEHPDLTPDGRFVTFFSLATNLVPGDTNIRRDIFVRDRQTGTVVRVSVSTAGEQGNSESQWPTISDDGLVTMFESSADNLVPNANGGIFAHDDRPAADLSVAKSDSPDPVTKGAALTYSVVVTNNGPAQATGVTLTDQLPLNVRFGSVVTTAGSCTEAAGTITCDLGVLDNGASATVTIIVTPKKLGTITNTAHVSSLQPDPNAANNTDTQATMAVR
ncbi:MAG: calcium-binding protein [Chloroflexi bacterium]|nr:calcium-binding protein [Chloroflexota bacterium]